MIDLESHILLLVLGRFSVVIYWLIGIEKKEILVVKVWAEPYFLKFLVPLIGVAASIFLKYVTRRDTHTNFKKEDLAVGLELSVAALLIFVAASSFLAQDLSQSPNDPVLLERSAGVPWILSAFILGIWGISTIVRKLGWVGDDRLQWFWGILLPNTFGVAVLLFVVNWIG